MADVAYGAEAGDNLSGVTDWRTAAERAEAAGSPLAGLPQGIRVRTRQTAKEASEPKKEEDWTGSPLKLLRQDVPVLGFLGVFCVVSAVFFLSSFLARSTEATTASRPACQQCQPGWWEHFWRWRLEGIALQSQGQERQSQIPPAGMEWEWAVNGSDTDWYGVSAEFVAKVVSAYGDPKSGPVLHVGCGDSPMPELLYKAGFKDVEHIDIAPQIVSTMQERFPLAAWPGMSFAVRDFLAPGAEGGPPPPLHRFAAVIDKAGIWDWLSDEAAGQHLPLLLSMVRNALLLGPEQRGLYILVTKQNPAKLSETLGRIKAEYFVQTSQPLGSSNMAWSYVLEPM